MGLQDVPSYEYTGREQKVIEYLINYGADIYGLQEVSTLGVSNRTADWFDVLGTNDNKVGLTANGYTCVTGRNLYWGEEYSEGLRTKHEKTMYNPIYFKTDKFNLIEWGSKWLTSTPDLPSQIDGMTTWKGLTYAVLEEKETGTRFIYVNVHYVIKAEIKSDGSDREYVYDTDGNRTEIWAQELETVYLRAILDDLQDKYDLPMFISGDFNNNDGNISGWFNNSYIDVENQIVTSEQSTVNNMTRYKEQIKVGETVLTEKPESNNEDVKITFAGSIAHYTSGKTLSSSAGGGNFSTLGPNGSRHVIDLWFVSNFDGIVHTYEIIDNKFDELNADKNNNIYPSDHLPAKLYVTLYID